MSRWMDGCDPLGAEGPGNLALFVRTDHPPSHFSGNTGTEEIGPYLTRKFGITCFAHPPFFFPHSSPQFHPPFKPAE